MERLAYSYTRFSTPEQLDGDSERRQMARFRTYCEQNGLVPSPDSFNDRGRSGYKGEHLANDGELRRFLDLVKEGAIRPGSVLVVENLDRLGRLPVEEAFVVFNGIVGAGIKLVTLGDDGVQEYVSGGGLFPLMMALMEMHRSHQESRRKAEVIRAVMGHKRDEARSLGKPIGDVCPTWLRLKPGWRSAAMDGSAYEPIPERAETVVRIFEWAIQGHGKAVIARMLTELGIASFKSTSSGSQFKPWSASGVGRILANRATLGEYQPMQTQSVSGKQSRIKAGDAILDYFPAVVSREMYYEAQAAVDGRRNSKATRQSSNGSLWQGIAKCERCGGSMHLINKGLPPKGGKYLRCSNVRSGLCKTGSVRVDESEQVFEGVLARLGSIALVKTDTAELERSARVLEGEIIDLQKKLDDLERQVIDAPSATLAKAIRSVEGARAEKQHSLHSINQQLATEQSVDWDEFLRRIDLVSFEGRMRANAYAKRLGILVYVGPSGYRVTRAGETLFMMDYRKGIGAGYWEKSGPSWMAPSFFPVRGLKQHLADIDASEEASARFAESDRPLTDEDIAYIERGPER